MFFSDMNILVAQEQRKDWLQKAEHERLIREIQYSRHQKSLQESRGWIRSLRIKRKLKTHPWIHLLNEPPFVGR